MTSYETIDIMMNEAVHVTFLIINFPWKVERGGFLFGDLIASSQVSQEQRWHIANC